MAVYKVPLSVRVGDETEMMEQKLEKLSNRIRVACPGIIQSFDSDKQTVSVKLAIREVVSLNGNPAENLEVPILQDVPIYMPRAGNFVLTMPVTIGDECLVIFGDNCIDAWWQSGSVSNQIDNRRHDLSDGMAIIGIWSQPKKISGYSTDSAVLRNLSNDSYVEVKDSEINVVSSTVNVIASTVNVDCDTHDMTASAASTENTGATKSISAAVINLTGTGSVTLNGGSTSIVVSGTKTQIDGKSFLDHTHLESSNTTHTHGVD